MKSLIVDDEYTASEYLTSLLEEHCPEVKAVDSSNDPREAISLLQREQYDVLFLDIEMPELDGFELIQQVGLARVPSIVFTTAYNNHASKAFGVGAVHYLLKPVRPELLKKAVKRAQKKLPEDMYHTIGALQPRNDRMVLVSGDDYFIVNFDDIIRVQGEGSYSTFYLTSGEAVLTSRRLAHYAHDFEGKAFMKTHQSHLVNLNHVAKYSRQNGGELFLCNDHKVPISSRMRAYVLKALQLK